jgi:hypothetical protein
LARHDSPFDSSVELNPEAADEVHGSIGLMPDRQVLGFLVQFFVTEISWLVLITPRLSIPCLTD